MTTETRYPTSIRLSSDEEELLDAWAEWLKASTGTKHSTSRTLRFLMRRALFEGTNSKEDKRVRAAYRKVFGTKRENIPPQVVSGSGIDYNG